MTKNELVCFLVVSLLVMTVAEVPFQPASAQSYNTVYIKPDGSIEPTTVPIQRTGNTYTFTADINNYFLVIQRDNIIVDGANFTFQKGTGVSPVTFGINITDRSNVTLKNLKINQFAYSIGVVNSSNITIKDSSIVHGGGYGIGITNSSNNEIIRNTVSSLIRPIAIAPGQLGVAISGETSVNNTISWNTVTGEFVGISGVNGLNHSTISWNNVSICETGIDVGSYCEVFGNNVFDTVMYVSDKLGDVPNSGTGIGADSHNLMYGNNFTGNGVGLSLESDNVVFGNNFVNNAKQAEPGFAPNAWDNGTLGNYWSDYASKYPNATASDNSGTGDTPYVIGANNTDRHPLLKPISAEQALLITPPGQTEPIPTTLLVVIVVIVIFISIGVALLVYLGKRK
jgi:hypothetical protein